MARRSLLKASTPILIRRYRQALKKAGVPFTRLILFGSRAAGTARPWSDIDLCVVSSSFGHDRHAERLRLSRIAASIEPLIEPVPYHPRDLRNRWDPLAAEIRRIGKTC